MKSSWTRLASFLHRKGMDPRTVERKFVDLFLRHHRSACEIVMDSHGEPMAAVYFTPNAKHKMWLKDFMAEVQRRTHYAYEQEHKP